MIRFVVFFIIPVFCFSQELLNHNRLGSQVEYVSPVKGGSGYNNAGFTNINGYFGAGMYVPTSNIANNSNWAISNVNYPQSGGIEFWVYLNNWYISNTATSDGLNHRFFSFGTYADSYNNCLFDNGVGLYWIVVGLNPYGLLTLTTLYIPSNTWTHLAFVWVSGGTQKVYVNGVERVSRACGTGTNAIINFYFGRPDDGYSAFDIGGGVDNLKMFRGNKTSFNDRFNERGMLGDLIIIQ